MDKRNNSSLMHGFNDSNSSSLFTKKIIGLLLVIVLLGIGTGYLLAGSNGGNSGIAGKIVNNAKYKAGDVVGDGDTATFKDTAEGIVKEGGIEGEGQYHLERPGGESQHVYMTSSTVDLSQFIDRKIRVWGQTQTAQTAGWLMDVGRIEVLE